MCVSMKQKKYKRTFNAFIKRHKVYNSNGRNQTEEEALAIDEQIRQMLKDNCIDYTDVDGTEEGYNSLVETIKVLVD